MRGFVRKEQVVCKRCLSGSYGCIGGVLANWSITIVRVFETHT